MKLQLAVVVVVVLHHNWKWCASSQTELKLYFEDLQHRNSSKTSRSGLVLDSRFPQIHKCKDGGEVYSAAYLTTKEHLLFEQFEPLNLQGPLTCERATWMMMRRKADVFKNVAGAPVQTLDLYDFSVIHLSAYERIIRKNWKGLRKTRTRTTPAAQFMNESITYLRSDEYINEVLRETNALDPRWKRTIAVMPILIGAMGKGHSNINHRLVYLKVCFWSLYSIIPSIVVSVVTEADKEYLIRELGLPFYDIIVLDFVAERLDGLPAATVLEVQSRMKLGMWDFDYLFYTESDQILMVRDADVLFDYLREHPLRMLIPHRLYPYPAPLLKNVFHKSPAELISEGPYSWSKMSCCMPQTNCLGDRSTWQHITDTSVKIATVFNLPVALGNGNFLRQEFRACALVPFARPSACSPIINNGQNTQMN